MVRKGPEERVLETLSEEWKSTSEIRNESEVHYYKVKSILQKLLQQDKVKRKERGRYATYWRLK